MKKVLGYSKDGEKVRVYWQNGICRTQEALDKVLLGGWSWDTLKTSGNTQPTERCRVKMWKPPTIVPVKFLGYQNPPKVAVKEVVLDVAGKVVPPKRGKKSKVTPDTIAAMKKLAAENKTLKEAETALGISYATLFVTSKKEGIVFAKGKKGRKTKTTA